MVAGVNSPLPAEGYASVPALKQYLQMAERCGVNCAPLLDRAGLSANIIGDNNRRIPLAVFEALLQNLIEQSRDTLFGFHTSEFIAPAFYSVHGYISLNCATLGEVLATIPVYEKIVGDMGVSDLSRRNGRTLLRWNCRLTAPLVGRHVRENIIASWFRFTARFLNITASPEEVWFEHAAPANHQLLTQYETLFGCPVMFSRPFTGIWIAEQKLSIPIAQADAKLLRVLLDHATHLLNEIDSSQPLAEQVKSMLRLMLNKRIPSSEQIAAKLGMSVRTLQRKLNEEGTSYKQVLDGLRHDLALYYVTRTNLNLDIIATRLGFTEPRSFYRSFKRWTGKTASAYRANRDNPLCFE